MGDHSVAHVALDTSKLQNAVAIAEARPDGKIRCLGEIGNAPVFSEVHDARRQALLQEAAQLTIDEARSHLTIRKLNIDGTSLGAVPDITPTLPPVKPQDGPPKP